MESVGPALRTVALRAPVLGRVAGLGPSKLVKCSIPLHSVSCTEGIFSKPEPCDG